MICRRSPSPTSPAPAQLPDDDDLREILLRLPPLPSTLPRASVVCKRWRCLVSDPGFLRRSRAHHRKPPLLCIFSRVSCGDCRFTPTMEQPDCIPGARFYLLNSRDECRDLVDCRHGLVLLLDRTRFAALVWEPIAGYQRRVAFPPRFINDQYKFIQNAAVLRAAGDDSGHVHSDCHLSPLKLVLVRNNEAHTRAFACLNESESGVWGNIILTTITDGINIMKPSILVGNSLCWLFWGGSILEFDFERQSLVVIEKPADVHVTSYSWFQTLRTEESRLGLAVLTGPIIEIWARKANSDGVVRWVFQKTVELDKLLPVGSSINKPGTCSIWGFDFSVYGYW